MMIARTMKEQCDLDRKAYEDATNKLADFDEAHSFNRQPLVKARLTAKRQYEKTCVALVDNERAVAVSNGSSTAAGAKEVER